MTCRQWIPDVIDVARGLSLDPAREEAVANHLRSCGSCVALAERHRAMSVALRRLASEQGVRQAGDAGLEKLLASFDARKARPRRMTVGVGLALAASVLIVVGLSVGWNAGAPAPPSSAGPSTMLAPSAAMESQFVILPGANALPRFESGQVIRIDIPEAELPALGLLSPSQTGVIQADVLVGQDGLARAVRFVQ